MLNSLERQFSLQGWEALPVGEKIKRCIRMASEAQKLADGADLDMAEGYLRLGERYVRLASILMKSD